MAGKERGFYVDAERFEIADAVATDHIKPRWLESEVAVMLRKIRLRTAIYEALMRT